MEKLILCLLLQASVQAQQIPTKVVSSPDDDKHVCVTRELPDSLEYILLDSGFHRVAAFTQPKKSLSNFFMSERSFDLHTKYEDEVFTTYFTLQLPFMNWTLWRKTIDFKTGDTEERPYETSGGDKRDRNFNTLGFVFSPGGDPVYLGLGYKGSMLHIDQLVSWGSYRPDSADFSPIHDPEMRLGFVHFVPRDQPQQLDNLAERTTAFSSGRQLLMISHQRNTDLLFSIIQVSTAEVHFRELSTRMGYDTLVNDYSVASTLVDNHLFVLRVSSYAAEIGVYTLPSMEMVKHVEMVAGKPPVWAEPPTEYRNNADAKPYDWAKMLDNMQSGPCGIAVNRAEDGTYLVTFGSFVDDRKGYNTDGRPNYRDTPNYWERTQGAPQATYSEVREKLRLRFTARCATVALDPSTLDVVPHTGSPAAVSRMLNVRGDDCTFPLGNAWYRLNTTTLSITKN